MLKKNTIIFSLVLLLLVEENQSSWMTAKETRWPQAIVK